MKNTIMNTDALSGLKLLHDNSIDCIITSPPYYQLRNYNHPFQIGLEQTFQEYLEKLNEIFMECYRVLKSDGTLWVVISDTYNGDKKSVTDNKYAYASESKKVSKSTQSKIARKSLLGIPERFMLNMIDLGWIARNKIIWHKPNAMPQSVKDRFTVDFENIFFFTKSSKYYFNQLKEPMKKYGPYGFVNKLNHLRKYNRSVGSKKTELENTEETPFKDTLIPSNDGLRNMRTVWNIATKSSGIEHYAMFPTDLVERFINSGCKPGGIVLDPFCGSGTTCLIAKFLYWF
jgi:DNA modification methylase